MQSQDIQNIQLPDTPGVYFFLAAPKRGGKEGEILYIGKATSLRDRVRSYFSSDIADTRGPKIVQMLALATTVKFQKTDSVLEALLLEAKFIKKYQPRYNTDGKDDKSYNYVVITKEDFPRVLLTRGRDLPSFSGLKAASYKLQAMYGPFPHGGELKEALRIIRKIFPFRDRCAPLQGKPCFNFQLGLCPGVCNGEISKRDYKKIIRRVTLFFEGKKTRLIKDLERQMKAYATTQEFEKAALMRKTIFALNHIQDIALIKTSYRKRETEKDFLGGSGNARRPFRIEAYDIAHISGTAHVGVMVVVEDGEAKKSDYRKFKIKTVEGANDTASLKEVLERRLVHASAETMGAKEGSHWPLPQLIVVDGSTAQVNTAKRVFKEHFEDLSEGIVIVGVVKNERHKPEHIIGDAATIRRYERAILLANSEAHRFAIGYHRSVRLKNLRKS